MLTTKKETNKTAAGSAARNSEKTRAMVLIALMTAVICILGPLTVPVPVSPVPISLQNLAIYFCIYILGMKRGTVSYLLYLLIGLAGVPVMAGFTGGPGKLFGPTGGYLIGFIFMALIAGWFIDHSDRRALHACGLILGTAVCYAFGTAWLAFQAGLSFSAALAAGVIPFIPGDAAKIILALLLGPVLRKRLQKAGLIINS